MQERFVFKFGVGRCNVFFSLLSLLSLSLFRVTDLGSGDANQCGSGSEKPVLNMLVPVGKLIP